MDNVNHPSHYTDGKIEVIDFIEDKKLNYHRGNAIKYISRAGKKDKAKELEDLKKARWYIDREIENLEPENNSEPDNNSKLEEIIRFRSFMFEVMRETKTDWIHKDAIDALIEGLYATKF